MLTEVSALSLSVLAPHAVCKVPPVKVAPPVIQIFTDNPKALVLGCATDVSPTKDNTFFSQVSAESIVLVGNGKLTFNEKDLKNLSSLSFTLLNNRGEKVGNVYNDFSIHRIKDNFNNIILNIEITVLREKIN